ncbi:MAG: nucleotide-diphospho-sugar transferase [Bacteroidetes bacterium]|nr:nucleotide-diphospho-sugar transferase [Bacteroidota bacterium]
MSTSSSPGPLRLPVLITAFSRYDTTREVMEAVRAARPPRLYFACDGGRNDAEREKCAQVRSLVELVDWDCQLFTLFHENNKGSKYGMAANIGWFFDHEPEGIILEDDIVPSQTFFRFAQELLEKYRDDERVWAIIGNNLMADEEPGDPSSYWYSAHGYGAYWGWASWRRSWQRFDIDMRQWPGVRDTDAFKDYYLAASERREATRLFEHTWDRNISTAWDYQFDFAKVLAGAGNIIPNVNLCRNIGFGAGGTHTVSHHDVRNKEMLHEASFPLTHPAKLEVDREKDLRYFEAFIRPSRYSRIKAGVKELLPDQLVRKVKPLVSGVQRKLGLQ